MRYDIYGLPIYNSHDIFDIIYQGNLDKIPELTVDSNKEIESLEDISGLKLHIYNQESISPQDFDQLSQSNWYMPEEYKKLDIEEYIIELITPWDDANDRVLEELEEFKNRNMLDLLRWLKYFVDYSLENNIIWGVGRGSSVASYVLFLLGVHHIDSIKYNLDWRDFLR